MAVPLPGLVAPGVTVAGKKSPQKVFEKRDFFVLLGSGGTPRLKTSKNACLQKSRVATGAKSMDFGAILGRLGRGP